MTERAQRPDLTGLTRRFAEHAATLQFDALPPEVVVSGWRKSIK